MKKRLYLVIISLFLFSIYIVSAKIIVSSNTLPITINKVVIDGENINVLVESKNNYKLYLMFDIKDKDGTSKRYFSDPNMLNSYEATYFFIPLEVQNPTYLYVTPYHKQRQDIVLYEFSKQLYQFTGDEYKIQEAPQATSAAVNIGQDLSTLTSTSNALSNTDTKTVYVKGIQKIEDSNIEYLHNDYLGSTRRVSDSVSAKQTLSLDYYYFGSPLKTYGYSSNYLSSKKKAFTSKEQEDKSGLYYFGSRYYNSLIGRFVSVDPVYKPSITPYSYADNNPLTFIDPNGEDYEKIDDFDLWNNWYVSAPFDATGSFQRESVYNHPTIWEASYDAFQSSASVSDKLVATFLGIGPRDPNVILTQAPPVDVGGSGFLKSIRTIFSNVKNIKSILSFASRNSAKTSKIHNILTAEDFKNLADKHEVLLFRGMSREAVGEVGSSWWTTSPNYANLYTRSSPFSTESKNYVRFIESGIFWNSPSYRPTVYVAKLSRDDLSKYGAEYIGSHLGHQIFSFSKTPPIMGKIGPEQMERLRKLDLRDSEWDNQRIVQELFK